MAEETKVEETPQTETKSEGTTEIKSPSPDELVNAMRYMFKEMQGMKGTLETIQGQAQQYPTPPSSTNPESQGASSTVDPNTSKPEDQSADVEMLDNRGLASYVENRVRERLRPWAEKVQQLNDTSNRTEVEQQVEKLRSDSTAHFDEFVNEVREVMEKKGGAISVEEALILAKAQDPNKVLRLNEQQKKDSPEKEADPFIGLLPTSGKASRNDRMDDREAASAAWEELGLDDIIKEIPN